MFLAILNRLMKKLLDEKGGCVAEMNYLRTAEFAARKAGGVLLDNVGRIRTVEFKAKNSLLTEIDVECENIIVGILKRNFPAHDILAEEGNTFSTGSKYRWIIDPLDGTMNYVHTYPFYSVSIALEYAGSVVAAVVYDPVKDEMFTAAKGVPSRLNGNGITVSAAQDVKDSLLATGFLHEDEGLVERNLVHFSDFIRRARGVRRDGSAALDLCYVACGRYDGFWELGLHPWDTAAGALIVNNAGGRVTDISGGEFSHYRPEIIATNNRIHSQIINILHMNR